MTELDTWLVCGEKIDSLAKNRGCTCSVHDPTPRLAREAIARRKKNRLEEDSIQVPH